MRESIEKDYVLGTHDDELERLGLQHSVWRQHVLACWDKAGVTRGDKVLDVGAGPGYASADLAEIVGEPGKVVAVERSRKYLDHLIRMNEIRGLDIKAHEIDLMEDEIPEGDFDHSWCRWVNSFVPNRKTLIEKIHKALKPGGVACFHEYIDYEAFRFAPVSGPLEDFKWKVVQSWRESGGETNVALQLMEIIPNMGFEIVDTKSLSFSVSPADYMWQWPYSFVKINIERMKDLGFMNEEEALAAHSDIVSLNKNPNSIFITPTVLEIICKKK
ncbi:MAG: class I SAM-dependent methyltransferase [Flavobacteriales bacterium]|nr:class I SAM-dependent methyltransferase [Flavobacteriales bacterium]